MLESSGRLLVVVLGAIVGFFGVVAGALENVLALETDFIGFLGIQLSHTT